MGIIANKVNDKNTDMAFRETFTNSAEQGIISQLDFFDHEVTNSSNIGGYYVVKPEDFVYNPRISISAPVGPINRNSLNRQGIISPLYTVFRVKKDVDTLFLEWFFKGHTWYSYMYLNGDTGARSDRFSIKNDTFFDMPISFPSRNEQEKIGVLFKQLDYLLTLHQRKLIMRSHISYTKLEIDFITKSVSLFSSSLIICK